MPSTRKQKAREKQSSQSDAMSETENLDIMLVSQAAACDGTRITTTTQGQETVSGTLPIY